MFRRANPGTWRAGLEGFVAEILADVDDPLFHLTGGGDKNHEDLPRREEHEFNVPDAARLRWGYCTTATWLVSWDSSRTVRSRTSSRSWIPPAMTGWLSVQPGRDGFTAEI